MSKLLVAVTAVVSLLAGACRTTGQAWTATAVGVGAAAVGALIIYNVRNDDEAVSPVLLGSVLVLGGGVTALLSLIDAVNGHEVEPAKPVVPSGAARQPCLDQRREISRQAAATTDRAERTRLLQSMPDCGVAPPER